MGAAIAFLLLLSTLGITACTGDGFTAGGLAAGGRVGTGGAATSNASGGAGGVLSTSSGGGGGASSTLTGGGGVGGDPSTTSTAGGGGDLTTSSGTSSSTETASSTANCGCPVDAPTAGHPCCVPSGSACTYGDCASGGQTDARCKGGYWFVKTTCAAKCGLMGAPCEPGEICLSKGPIAKLAWSCAPDPCVGVNLDCACAKPALCPEEDYSCSQLGLDVIQCLE